MTGMMDPLASPAACAAAALEAAGFRADASGFLVPSAPPGARLGLQALPPAAGWQRFASLPTKTFQAAAGALQGEAEAPAGPFKMVKAASGRGAILVADLPLDLLERVQAAGDCDATAPEITGLDWNPFALWAEDLHKALVAGGRGPDPDEPKSQGPPPEPTADLTAWLNRCGWIASESGGEAKVNFESPRYFKQVRLRRDRSGDGTVLDMELAEIQDWKDASLAAAHQVAAEANERLRLVRLVSRSTRGRQAITAQVHLGRQPVRSAWMLLGLEAMRCAAELLACELPALADAALAEVVVHSRIHPQSVFH